MKVIDINDPKYQLAPGRAAGPAQAGPGFSLTTGGRKSKKKPLPPMPTPTESERVDILLMMIDTIQEDVKQMLLNAPDSKSLNKAAKHAKRLRKAMEGRQAALSIDELPF